MPHSDPSFAEKTPENHPFCAPFRALVFGQIALVHPGRQLSAISLPPMTQSLNRPITQSPNSSITQSPDHSITQFFSRAPVPAATILDF
jgi:hypothetical protein